MFTHHCMSLLCPLKKKKNIITLKDVIVVIFRRTKLFMSHTAKAFMHNKVQNLKENNYSSDCE